MKILGEEEQIKIIESRPLKAKNPTIILALPDVGLVGVISAMQMIESLEPRVIGEIESELFPPITIIHEGKILAPIRIYEKNGIVIIVSEIPIPTTVIRPLISKIVSWAIEKNASLLLIPGGTPSPNRLEIDSPKVFAVATNDETLKVAKKHGADTFREGILVGPHAIALMESVKKGLNALSLMAQSFLNYPDPGAAASIIEILNKMLKTNISVEELLKKAEEIRVRTRDLMRHTSDVMRRMGKMKEYELPPLYR